MKNVNYLLLLLVLLNSCAKEEDKKTTCDTTSVTYSSTIRSILNDNCMNCHNSGSALGGVVLETHAQVAAYSTSLNDVFYVSLTTATGAKKMPQGGSLPNCDIEKVKTWIEAGAPNN
jgi:uncharacterized membrane protein